MCVIYDANCVSWVKMVKTFIISADITFTRHLFLNEFVLQINSTYCKPWAGQYPIIESLVGIWGSRQKI